MSEKRKIELLSPAGSMEGLKAAVNNGCDAVYLGGKSFSARQYAGNFSLKELEEACDYCHLRGIDLYVTVNTLYKDAELDAFMEYIAKLYVMGVDALIVQDIGAVRMIRRAFPDFLIHASTQMTANSLADVKYWEEEGVTKVVLSRELSLKEIKEITDACEAEIETFVHGALCVSYSGQCIMSSMLGGRSGNRGRCAQTCRLPYGLYNGTDKVDEGYLLSPKDMETITILPELIEAGISSFKIEGRMKNSEYVAGVTQVYRKYIDMYFEDPEGYQVDPADLKMLTQLFNRGGFSQGYYHSFAGRGMMSVERPKTWGLKVGFVDNYIAKYHRLTIRTREALVPGDGIEVWTQEEPHVGTNISKQSKAGEVIALSLEGNISKNDAVYRTYDKVLYDTLQKTWQKDTRKLSVWGSVQAKKGEPITFSLWDMNGHRVYVTGEIVEKAENQPLSVEKLSAQMSKMGNTSFFAEEILVDADADVYVGISALNQLRREGVQALEEMILKKIKRVEISSEQQRDHQKAVICRRKKLNILVSNKEQFEIAVQTENANIIYVECSDYLLENLMEFLNTCRKFDVKLYVALPRIARQWEIEKSKYWLETLKNSAIDGFLVRSAGEFGLVKDIGKKITVDYTMNIMNEEAVRYWQERGADTVCLCVEANLQEMNAMGNQDCEMVVYGYLPLMKTQQCPIGNYAGGKDGQKYCSMRNKDGLYFLRDRKEMKFPLMTDCEHCTCTILNSKPLFTLKFYDEILESVTGSIRLDFTKEGAGRTARLTKAYSQMTDNPHEISAEIRDLLEEMKEKGSTKGHFFRGVE